MQIKVVYNHPNREVEPELDKKISEALKNIGCKWYAQGYSHVTSERDICFDYKEVMTEPEKMTFHAYVEDLGIPIEKAMELAKFVRSAMREDLVNWLNTPEKWESNS